jgi:hemolysin activation/secretion protein
VIATHKYDRLAMACLVAMLAPAFNARAEQAPPPPPEPGTIERTQEQRQLPTLPAPGAPELTVVAPTPAYMGPNVAVKPKGFRIVGSRSIPESELQAVVAPWVDKDTDIAGLLDAAAALRQYFAARGHVLTDVYLSQQDFPKEGGIVELRVLEARLGGVQVKVEPGSGVSQAYADALAAKYLQSGDPITQGGLDRPILLLRDLPGTDAEGTVSPGQAPGESDVSIDVKPRPPGYRTYVALDNMGERAAGEYRLALGVDVYAPFGIGDIFSARVQGSNEGGNALYRFTYGAAVGNSGTKLIANFTRSDYSLGQQFEALGATGIARVSSLTAIEPFVRGRLTNVFGTGALEYKLLDDNISTQIGSSGTKHDSLVRFGVLGNHSDTLLAGGTTSASVSLAGGFLQLDAQSAAIDAGVPGAFGPHTAGNFAKLNLEAQRAQYFDDRSNLLLSLVGQLASKNLTSAEKIGIGGPLGVRGYPVGEGIGDDGLQGTIEYRYRTGWHLFGEEFSLTAFYDVGRIRRDHVRNDTTLNASTTPNGETLDSAGVGFLIGREDHYVATFNVSSRIGGPLPTTGDPDSRARIWFLLQKWF